MNYFHEITLKPDADTNINFLWAKLYQQLHHSLIATKDNQGKINIGVSFPAYNPETHQLGNKLRLFAESQAQLEQFNAWQRFKDMDDYLQLMDIHDLTNKKLTYGCFYRIQPKSNNQRLARRKAKRENTSVEQAIQCIESRKEQHIAAPYINLKSQSNRERFRLFIGYQEQTELKNQGFNSYGLSKTSTVPIF